jgi:DNA polymerase-3 subunit alpha
MMGALDGAIARGSTAQTDRASGQSSLFGMFAAAVSEEEQEFYPTCDGWHDRELLRFEKASIGFYVTGHPLDRYEQEVGLYATRNTGSLQQMANREPVSIAGVVSSLRERRTRSGDGRMAYLQIEDRHGQVECICFSEPYAKFEELVKSDEPLLLKGTIHIEGDERPVHKIRLSEVSRLVDARREKVARVVIELDADSVDEARMSSLAEVLRRHPGKCTTEISLRVVTNDASGHGFMVLPEDFNVEPSDDLIIAVERLFGDRVVRLQ